ncbi:hypothetical protein HK102_002520 [Quaeritorhiza haematococci]|nr:hypothetical protein HK102_002520 [Quaeritorhiza haematococci]
MAVDPLRTALPHWQHLPQRLHLIGNADIEGGALPKATLDFLHNEFDPRLNNEQWAPQVSTNPFALLQGNANQATQDQDIGNLVQPTCNLTANQEAGKANNHSTPRTGEEEEPFLPPCARVLFADSDNDAEPLDTQRFSEEEKHNIALVNNVIASVVGSGVAGVARSCDPGTPPLNTRATRGGRFPRLQKFGDGKNDRGHWLSWEIAVTRNMPEQNLQTSQYKTDPASEDCLVSPTNPPVLPPRPKTLELAAAAASVAAHMRLDRPNGWTSGDQELCRGQKRKRRARKQRGRVCKRVALTDGSVDVGGGVHAAAPVKFWRRRTKSFDAIRSAVAGMDFSGNFPEPASMRAVGSGIRAWECMEGAFCRSDGGDNQREGAVTAKDLAKLPF